MRVIAKKILREFWAIHADAEQALKVWHQEAGAGTWSSLNELKKYYPGARILGDTRVVFNIKGNKYRLIVKINFAYQMMWIRFIGTHAKYDKINAVEI